MRSRTAIWLRVSASRTSGRLRRSLLQLHSIACAAMAAHVRSRAPASKSQARERSTTALWLCSRCSTSAYAPRPASMSASRRGQPPPRKTSASRNEAAKPRARRTGAAASCTQGTKPKVLLSRITSLRQALSTTGRGGSGSSISRASGAELSVMPRKPRTHCAAMILAMCSSPPALDLKRCRARRDKVSFTIISAAGGARACSAPSSSQSATSASTN
mmetsp:Transcript_28836/g.79174  ORF Transcript_28836/g.79174 Transcript_28836/m.79174 type:complete len:217 (-) Transcript_28836:2191-2841(-)